jgi:hypothetical protein
MVFGHGNVFPRCTHVQQRVLVNIICNFAERTASRFFNDANLKRLLQIPEERLIKDCNAV